ncbi:MAG: HAD family hydrolase [Bacteroidales bacterium]|nr:HAD family hydrolase [Bacteroidales bacterium]
MKYDLVIFDLDGTLLNTIEDLGDAVNHALESKGFAGHGMREYKAMVGNGVRKLVERAIPEAFRQSTIIDDVLGRFITHYEKNIDVKTKPYRGMQRLLADLSASGVKLAVASNKFQSGTETLVAKFFGDIPFVAVFGNKEGQPLKPSPELVRQICSMAFPEGGEHRVALVGDSDTDMATARNAGIDAVAVTWGFRSRAELEQAGAENFASTALQLRQFLK